MTIIVTAPTTTISFTPVSTFDSQAWVTGSTTFSLIPNDAGGPGIASTYYKIYDNTTSTEITPWTAYTSGTFTLGSAASGQYTIQWCSIDTQGDNQTLQSQVLYIDTAPTTTISFTPVSMFDSQTWVTGSTVFSLNPADSGGSGVASTYYKIYDNTTSTEITPWTLYSLGTFTLGSVLTGTYTIQWSSISSANDNQTLQSQVAFIDAAPMTTISFTPVSTYNSQDWVTGSTTFSLNPLDSGGTGVASTYYKIYDNTTSAEITPWTAYTSGMFTLGSASTDTYTIQWSSISNANDNQTLQSQVVYIDAVPTTTISFTPVSTFDSQAWITGSTPFTLNPADTGSGIANTYYKIYDNTTSAEIMTWTLYASGTFTLGSTLTGTYTIQWSSISNANDNQTLQSQVVYIDAAPTTTISFTAVSTFDSQDWVTRSTTFSLNPLDTGGTGVASTYYKIYDNTTSTEITPWTLYTSGTFTLDSALTGTYTIQWSSISNANDNQTLQSQVVYIDAAPTTTISFTPVFTFDSQDWVAGSTTFSLNPTAGLGGTGVANTYYKIYDNTTSTEITPWTAYTSGTFMIVPAVNGTYTIQWCSISMADDNQTLQSQVVYIDTNAPTTPQSFSATPGNMNVTLTWAAPASNGGSPITGYIVYVGLVSGSEKLNVTLLTPVTTYMVTNLKNGYTYYFLVAAVNGVGLTGANSTRINSMPEAPSVDAPITTILYTATYMNGTVKWVTRLTVFTLTAVTGESNSPIEFIGYKINAGPWIDNASNPAEFTLGVSVTNGTYTIAYNSTDMANDVELTRFITVYVDTIASTTLISFTPVHASGLIDWVTDSTMFTLAATDNTGGSGVQASSYQITANGVAGPLMAYSEPFTLGSSANGTYTIAYYSTDNVGNVEGAHLLTVYVDSIAPTTSINFTPVHASGSTDWVIGSTTFMLVVTDNTGGSGVQATFYQVTANGVAGSLTAYSGPFTLGSPANGTYTIAYYSTDNVGNVEGTNYCTVYVDSIAPTTLISFTPVHASGSIDWVTDSMTFTLAATDNTGGSGVQASSFQITANGVAGPLMAYSEPFTLGSSANGTYTIAYYSTDNAGNVEGTHHLTVYVDSIAPTTSIGFTPVHASGSTDWVIGSTTFTLVATDNTGGSGVQATFYQVTANGVAGSLMTYSVPFTLGSPANGTYTIAYYSTDNVGNVEGTHHLTVYIDTIAPITMLSFNTVYAPNYVNAATLFTLTAAGGSGILATSYQVTANGVTGSWTTYSGPFALGPSVNGTCIIAYNSTDNVGNIESTKMTAVIVDLTPPMILELDVTTQLTSNEHLSVKVVANDTVGIANVTIAIAGAPAQLFTIVNTTTFTYAGWSSSVAGSFAYFIVVTDNVNNTATLPGSIVVSAGSSGNAGPGNINLSAVGLPALPIPLLAVIGIVVITAGLVKQRNKPSAIRIKAKKNSSKGRDYKAP